MQEKCGAPRESAAEWTPIDDLKPWAENPRKNEAAVKKVMESIKRFGWGAPLLARAQDKVLIAGHTRLLAAKALGLREAPVRFLDLDPADAKLLALADNRLGEIAEWDEDRLASLLAQLKLENLDLSASGFEANEIDRLLAEFESAQLADVVEDEVPQPPEQPESEVGKLYELGPHRLLCGDSTIAANVTAAMEGRQADLMFTDPPYGVNYQSHMSQNGTAARFRRIENDGLAPDELTVFLEKAFRAASASLRPGAAVYVCHANQRAGLYAAFEGALSSSDFHIGGCIVWVKPSATMGWQDYRNRYEPILYGWKLGADRIHVDDRTETNVWEIDRDPAVNYEHPTQKPTALPMRAIKNSSVAGNTVLDLFAGSGSTLIAAAKTGRRAVLVEKDPGYCDVIRQRWERFVKKVSP